MVHMVGPWVGPATQGLGGIHAGNLRPAGLVKYGMVWCEGVGMEVRSLISFPCHMAFITLTSDKVMLKTKAHCSQADGP